MQDALAFTGVEPVGAEGHGRERLIGQHSDTEGIQHPLGDLAIGVLAAGTATDQPRLSLHPIRPEGISDGRGHIAAVDIFHPIGQRHVEDTGVQNQPDRHRRPQTKDRPVQARRLDHLLADNLLAGVVFHRLHRVDHRPRRRQMACPAVDVQRRGKEQMGRPRAGFHGREQVQRAADVDVARELWLILAVDAGG